MDRRALIIGATGAVGSALVAELLAAPQWSSVTALVRRKSDKLTQLPNQEKLRQIEISMETLERDTLAAANSGQIAFCTMGIGQPSKVSRADFWKVDVDYVGAFAKACKAAGIAHISLLSSTEANPASRSYYMKVKGSSEEAVKAQNFTRMSFFRPSLLATDEIRYGFSDRLMQFGVPLISWAFPSRFHEIHVKDLARAMRINAEHKPKSAPAEILHYRDFIDLLHTPTKSRAVF